MLRLDNIQAKVDRPIFKPRIRKFLRISAGSMVKYTNSMAIINNQQMISWSQSISIPFSQYQTYSFQIFDKHQFGYNPQQLQTVLKGTLLFDNLKDANGKWTIFTSGEQKIGVLQATIAGKITKKVSSIWNQNSNMSIQLKTYNNDNKIWRITSIIARMLDYDLKKAWISVQVQGKKFKTQPIKSKAGQLIYMETKQMNLENGDNYASIKVYTDKNKEQQSMLGEAILLLDEPKPEKKLMLKKKGVETGQLYIQSSIIDKRLMKNNSNTQNEKKSRNSNDFSLQTIQKEQMTKPKNESFNQRTNQTKVQSKNKVIEPYRSLDFSRLENYGLNNSRISRPSYADLSMISTKNLRKRNSILNTNNNIVFPKEKRFPSYGEKKNQRITYLRQRSFEFKSPRTGRYYRGASFGFGDKTDFSKERRQSPGVGNYKLPSIWDRY